MSVVSKECQTQALIDKGVNITAFPDEQKPIHLAAQEGQAAIVELLLDKDVDINARTGLGATALLFAIENKHKDVVDVLLKYSADTSIPLHTSGGYHEKFNVVAGDTPLHLNAN